MNDLVAEDRDSVIAVWTCLQRGEEERGEERKRESERERERGRERKRERKRERDSCG
jgi:hypothetical protein